MIMAACLIRAAVKTLSDVDELQAELFKCADDSRSLERAAAGDIKPDGWDASFKG